MKPDHILTIDDLRKIEQEVGYNKEGKT